MTSASAHWRKTDAAILVLVSMLTIVSVSTVYWPQAMLAQLRTDLGEPAVVTLLPGASLLGYAGGVTTLAVASKNLAGRSGLTYHMAILVAGLTAFASAPSAMIAVVACVFVGAGCALTQRLLIVATNIGRAEKRAEIIGLIIASGLSGIVVARAWVGDIAQHIGWRQSLFLNAFLISLIIAILFVLPWPKPTEPVTRPISMPRLWCRYPTLRHAALHQAVIFAAFNAGWAVLPIVTTTTPTTRALVAGIGALTAIAAGQAAGLLRPACLVAVASVFIVFGASMAIFIATRLAFIGAMICIEVGTQLALVANQTRAQAIAPDVGSRGRMASLVTALSFAGGAIGAAVANMLVR